jgi:C1A family cysteine protease
LKSADTEAEYQQRSGYFYVNVTGTGDEIPIYDPPTVATADIPQKIDWVAAGATTTVKSQGRCGCSWSTAVCGAIEGCVIENKSPQGFLFYCLFWYCFICVLFSFIVIVNTRFALSSPSYID